MEPSLQESMASGVFVEVRDVHGHTRGETVFLDWHARPLPGIGDVMVCDVRWLATNQTCRVRGRVESRQFDIQREDNGTIAIWVHVVLAVSADEQAQAATDGFSLRFSQN